MTSVSRFQLRWAFFLLAALAVGLFLLLRAQPPFRAQAKDQAREELFQAAGIIPSQVANPDAVLKTLEGQAVPLRDFRGKVVLLNFWATWCPPCRLEMPWMETLYKELKGRDFTILAVSIDGGGPEPVRRFVEELGLTFPIFHDPKMELGSQFGLTGLPTTYLIDREGKVLGQAIGPREWHKGPVRALLESLLDQKSLALSPRPPKERVD